jgi:uncharacterized membrane protein
MVPSETPRWPAGLALGASLLGLFFAGTSTLDYVKHLDRQVHGIHCSFIPGASVEQSADNACRVAMYSPYSALFRDRYWGGIPISLLALGAFAFFAAFALYLLLAASTAPRRASQFFGAVGLTPLLVSILMGVISATKLGEFCKTCVGIYIASTLLAVASIAMLMRASREPTASREEAARAGAAGLPPTAVDDAPRPRRRTGGVLLVPACLLALGLFTVTPSLLYARTVPAHTSYISSCGKLEKPEEPSGALLRITPAGAHQPATLFVDPLCPTCRALHQRLVSEGVFSQLDTTLVLFPLDSECNWMLDRPVHPGACLVSKAVLCADHRALQVLEWAYDNQESLLEGGRAAAGTVNTRAALRQRWPDLDACIDAKETKLRLDKMLRYIVSNKLPVSTPQVFLGGTRLCDEDSDIGLPYAIRKLAPGLTAGSKASR